MCYLDVIVGPNPIIVGGTVLMIAVGLLLLCGIVLATMGFIKEKQKNDKEKDNTK